MKIKIVGTSLWKTHRVRSKRTRFNLVFFYKIKEDINLNELSTIEVGCGKGQLSLLLSQVAEGVTLLDYSGNTLKLAKKLLEMHEIDNCSFVQDDLFDLHHNKKFLLQKVIILC